MSLFHEKTYITVVELPEALPAQARGVAQPLLENSMQEAEQEIDTTLLDWRLAGSQ